MNSKKIGLFLLTTLIIWFVSFKAMRREEQEIAQEERQIYEIIAEKVAKKEAHRDAKIEMQWPPRETEASPSEIELFQKIAEGEMILRPGLFSSEIADLQAIYDKKYQEEYARLYASLSTKYRHYEENWDVLKERFQNSELQKAYSWVKQLIGGNLTYAMTLDEIRQMIKNKFMAMEQKGLIISRAQYKETQDKYINLPSIDLIRIWGSQYLEQGVKEAGESAHYGVPGFVIVTDNPNLLNITLSTVDSRFPIAFKLKKGEAFIDFVKIIGSPAGYESHYLPKRLGYVDFDAEDNILREEGTGKYYIVDTEQKSFGHKRGLYPKPYPLPTSGSFADYANEKFQYLHGDGSGSISITINLEEEVEEEEGGE